MANKEFDTALNGARVFFLFSVIVAHANIRPAEASTPMLYAVLRLFQYIGLIGVPCFLIVSGMLFSKGSSFASFAVKKLKRLAIPTLFCGTAVYFLANFDGLSVVGYLRFILGIGSYLYYITVLLALYLIMYLLPERLSVFAVCIVFAVANMFLCRFGLYEFPISTYYNIFVWIGYFALGRIFALYDLPGRLCALGVGARAAISACALPAVAVGFALGVDNYMDPCLFVTAVPVFIGVYVLCTFPLGRFWFMQHIGNISFSVYLLHMPLVAALKTVVRRVNINLFPLIAPITLLIMATAFYIYLRLTERMNKKTAGIFNLLLGLR